MALSAGEGDTLGCLKKGSCSMLPLEAVTSPWVMIGPRDCQLWCSFCVLSQGVPTSKLPKFKVSLGNTLKLEILMASVEVDLLQTSVLLLLASIYSSLRFLKE